MTKIDTAHPPSFWRHLRQIEREMAAQAAQAGGGAMPTVEERRKASRALGRALGRGAVSEGRVAHYASLIRRGRIDAASIDRLADPQHPHGLAGGDWDAEDELDPEIAALFPPATFEEAIARHEADQIAAAAARDAAGDELSDEEWTRLFRYPPPED
jgi:hypothetical protein